MDFKAEDWSRAADALAREGDRQKGLAVACQIMGNIASLAQSAQEAEARALNADAEATAAVVSRDGTIAACQAAILVETGKLEEIQRLIAERAEEAAKDAAAAIATSRAQADDLLKAAQRDAENVRVAASADVAGASRERAAIMADITAANAELTAARLELGAITANIEAAKEEARRRFA